MHENDLNLSPAYVNRIAWTVSTDRVKDDCANKRPSSARNDCAE
jgi:hypothetical protein